LLTGVATTFVLMSVTMPFVVLLNLIGGSDLRYMVIVLIEIFVVVQIMNALAILIASIFKMPFAHFISLFIMLIVLGVAYSFITEVITYIDFSPSGLSTSIGLFIFETILFTLFVCTAIVKFAPKNSNRSFFIRVFVTVIFVIMTFISILFISSPLHHWLSYVVSVSFFILMFFLIIVVCENDQWTPRIRRGLPKSLFCRFIMFPFYTGSACGLAWIVLMTAILALVDLSIIFPHLSFGSSLFGSFIRGDKCWKIVLLFILVFDICVTAMLIRSWFLKQVNTSRVWLIAILVLSFVVFGSIIVAGIYFAFHGINFIDVPTWWIKYQDSEISSINPFVLFLDIIINHRYDDFFIDILSPLLLIPKVIHALMMGEVPFSRCYVAIGWAIILLPFLFVWYRQRLKNFSPYNIEETISYEEVKEAVE
jgi:hypothetical protein